ncbi:rhamnan synthesis F family protein [Phaeobacter sp. HF9A]|uniref:rhamnan synthesis F family protein n=1 Tax=Phaeobacter sp. HF9A TaxID=2721561 RepID=UPI00143021AB|nr:rhamnan synthesis F family protein [Phaeobacter sp. HF9A]NIZ12945.1 glycosyltransferase [Phaeobacter sp. HF9A]
MPRFSVSDITIVTVSYNSSPILPDMLKTVPDGVKVIVVDNGGHDRPALDRLSAQFGFQLISCERNFGFGSACNTGVAAAQSEYVLLLNPDAMLAENTLDLLLEAAARHDGQTAFGPAILSPDGTPDFKRRSVLLPRKDWLPKGMPTTERDVPVLTGSAIFATRALFSRVPFDPLIFMYHEDDDWSLRLRKSGGRLVFVPDAQVPHKAGHSSGRDPAIARFKAFHLAKSRIQTMRKHKLPVPRLRAYLKGFLGLLSPENLVSPRKRAKNVGFLMGAHRLSKAATSPKDLKPLRESLPGWKVRRELMRLLRQLKGLPRSIFERYIASHWYDAFKRKEIKLHDGELPAQDKVAIYLIFPKDGVLESHVRSLAYMREAGYAPFVVSNLPLSDADRERLKSLSWRVMERPNIGYDFGGYRDGCRVLGDDVKMLKRLVLLNDSSWFPIPGSQNWLRAAEELGLDYVSANTSYGVMRVDPDHYHAIQWNHDTSLRDFHYCSYALSIGPNLLQSPKFIRYWKAYPLTENKNKVVRRGEMGLSRLAVDNGFSHGATFDIPALPALLDACTDEELNRYAQGLVCLGEERMRDVLEAVLPDMDARRSAGDRQDVINLLLTTSARTGLSYTMPQFLWEKHGFDFLKKSPVSISKEDSDVMLALAQRIAAQHPAAGYIVEEMQAIRSRKNFSTEDEPTNRSHMQGSS